MTTRFARPLPARRGRTPLDTRPLAYALSRMHPSLLAALVDEASLAGDELAEVA